MPDLNWEDRLELGPECFERFLNQQLLPAFQELSIAIAGISQLRGEYCVSRKNPDYHTILFTFEGQGVLLTPEGKRTIPANSLTVLPAGQPFLITLEERHWATTWFCLEDSNQWQHLKQPQADIRFSSHASALYYLLGHLYYEQDPTMRTAPLAQLRHYLSSALGDIAREDQQQESGRRLSQLFADIQEQLHVDWTIASMAERVHYSPPHLHRLCKQFYHRSPIQQLIHLRIERAKQLLADTNWTLVQIASTLGYSDVFNFSTRFKKSTGASPSAFRLQHKRRPAG